MEIRNSVIGYSVRKKNDNDKEIMLEKEILELETRQNKTEHDLELKILTPSLPGYTGICVTLCAGAKFDFLRYDY